MKNEKQHRLLFIIPAVIIAIILIICIAVAVSSKSGEKGKKKDSRSVSVTENTQDIVAESETLELVKKDALKETNVVDKDNKQNNGTQSDTMIIPHRQPVIQIMQIQRQINLLTNHQKTKQQQIKRHRQAAKTHRQTAITRNNLQVTIQNRQHQIRQLHLSRLKVSPRSRKHQKRVCCTGMDILWQ